MQMEQVPVGQRTVAERLALLAILLLAAALRFGGMEVKSLWFDELSQVSLALLGFPALAQELVFYAGLPLDYVLQVASLGLGLSEFAVRFHAALLGIATVPLTFVLVRALVPQRYIALLATLLLAVFPFHWQYSQEARPYALFAFAQLLALYCIWRALKNDDRRAWWGFAGAEILAFNTHYFALIFLLPLVLAVFVRAWQVRTDWWRGGRLCLHFAGGIMLAFLSWIGTPWLSAFWIMGQRMLGLLPPPNFVPLPIGFGESLGNLRALLLLDSRLGIVFAALLLLGAMALLRRNLLAGVLILSWILLPIVVAGWMFSQSGLPLEARFLIPILPAYVVIIASGSSALAASVGGLSPHRFRPQAVAGVKLGLVVILLFLLAGRVRAYYAWDKEPWREAVEFVKRTASPEDALLIPHVESALRVYGPDLDYTMWEPKTLADVQSVAMTHPRLWVIWSLHHDMTNEDAVEVLHWLRDSAVEFEGPHGVSVFYWRNGQDVTQMLEEARDFEPVPPLNYVAP